jgi:fido (protein-threonine AMPylation protein)/predicted phosphodiesterase
MEVEEGGRRDSRALIPPLITDPDERAAREVENGFRQLRRVEEAVDYYKDPERTFRLRPSLIMRLHREALDGISTFAGNARPGSVEIKNSKHTPPPALVVQELIEDMCDYINNNWKTATPIHLAAYVMWRFNWIHPFDDGNGRTSRAVSYLVLCIKLGGSLPGLKTIPDYIVDSRDPYYEAIEAADQAEKQNRIDVTAMEALLDLLLQQQLDSIARKARQPPALSPPSDHHLRSGSNGDPGSDSRVGLKGLQVDLHRPAMTASWLHVSDFHFKSGDPYDRDFVLRALVRSVAEFRKSGRQPDLIFATGDMAHSGQESEYQAATNFFDALCAAAGVDKRRLYVIPGNHDIDRALGIGLARTFSNREDADTYFGPSIPKPHITQKQRAFRQWYDQYFDGIRTFPTTSTCGPLEVVEIGSLAIGILPVNSALFCEADDDHTKLWIGRRCVDTAVEELGKLGVALKIALIHHPLDWLHDAERSNVRTALQSNVDILLRGHLHETDVEGVAGMMGNALHMAAGAAYQTRVWPNRALYASVQDGKVEVLPIRYEDQPHEIWTIDPSVFPEHPYTRVFAIPESPLAKM